jgi:hypothetical protein
VDCSGLMMMMMTMNFNLRSELRKTIVSTVIIYFHRNHIKIGFLCHGKFVTLASLNRTLILINIHTDIDAILEKSAILKESKRGKA